MSKMYVGTHVLAKAYIHICTYTQLLNLCIYGAKYAQTSVIHVQTTQKTYQAFSVYSSKRGANRLRNKLTGFCRKLCPALNFWHGCNIWTYVNEYVYNVCIQMQVHVHKLAFQQSIWKCCYCAFVVNTMPWQHACSRVCMHGHVCFF